MDEKILHDLAVAYAQVKLTQFQDEYGKSGDSDELYEFAKAYRFAIDNFESEYDKIN
jgi:hypothetical protein